MNKEMKETLDKVAVYEAGETKSIKGWKSAFASML